MPLIRNAKCYFFFKVLSLFVLMQMSCQLQVFGKPGASSSLVERADSLIDEDRIEPAMKLLNSILAKNPRDAAALIERSRAFRKISQYEKAVLDANRAVALAPRSSTIRTMRVPLYLEAQRYRVALRECNIAIANDPRDAEAYFMRGLVYKYMDRPIDVIRESTKAIALSANTSDYFLLRSSAWKRVKQSKRAASDLKKALAASLHSAHPNHVVLAQIYDYLHKYKSALAECNFDLKLNPLSFYGYSERAWVFDHLGQYQDEIDDLRAAIKLNPRDVDSYESLVYAESQLGKLPEEIADCQKALILAPGRDVFKWRLARAYEESGQHEKAIQEYTYLLKKNNYALDRGARAHILELLGRHDQALSDWRIANQRCNSSERLWIQEDDPLIELNRLSRASYKTLLRNQLLSQNAVLDFTYDSEGHFGVPVYLNGKLYQFMLDTGCPCTQLWTKHAAQIVKNLKVDIPYERADGTKAFAGTMRVQDFALGNIQLTNLQLDVDQGEAFHESMKGFLGGNILENFAVTIDYSKRKVCLANSLKSVPEHALVVPMLLLGHRPYCAVRVDDKFERMALLDTGAPSCTSPDSLLRSALPQKLEFPMPLQGPWIGVLHCNAYRVEKIALKNLVIEKPLLEVFSAAEGPAAATEIVLGNDFLSRFKKVTFDYPARRIIFERNGDSLESGWNYRNEARFYLWQDDDKHLIEYLCKFMQLEPVGSRKYHMMRAEAYARLKDYKNALRDFDQEIRLHPNNAYALFWRGWTYGSLKQYQRQVDDDTAAIKLCPEYIQVYENRAWAYEKLGSKKLAEADRQTAKALRAKFK